MNIQDLLQQPEGPSLEFKARLPRLPDLAKLVAGIANAEGGKILIGYNESTRQLLNVDEPQVRRDVDRVQRMLGSDLQLVLSFLVYQETKLAVLEVARAQGLVGVDGGYFVRTGARTQLMTAADIREALVQQETPLQSLDRLAEAVANQSAIIEQIRGDLALANSPARKIGIALGGAAAGALTKWLIGLALGLL